MSTISPEPGPASARDVAAVVVAAVVARVMQDNSFGGSAVFGHVNVVERYGSPTPDGFVTIDESSPLIETNVRLDVERALAPAVVTWIANAADVIGTGQDLPSFEEVGAVVTLSHPVVDGSRATITTGLWCGGECGIGGAQRLERTESQGWVVTGSDGPHWIS